MARTETTLFAGASRSSAGGSKRSTQVAKRIVDDVIALGWPVGDVLGSEAELLERYDVSRAVFREAVRLVELQQVVRMRRGPGGGLVVTEPSLDAVIDAAVMYLYRLNTRLDEVFEARAVLEGIVAELATERIDEDDVSRVREVMAREADGLRPDPREFHSLLASITHNPALELFVDIMNRVSVLYFSNRNKVASATAIESHHAHERIAASVVGGDITAAQRRMRKHLEAEAEFLRRRRSARQVLPATSLGAVDGAKRADALARQLIQKVVTSGDEPGTMIGSEAELMERYGVSRAILREAVRIIEHHRVAAMRRGPGGGLFVIEPDPSAVTEMVALYLERQGIAIADLGEVRKRLELVLIAFAMENLDDDGRERLIDARRREDNEPGVTFAAASHDLHAVIAGLANNRALELIALVLIRLTRLRRSATLSTKARKVINDGVSEAHDGVVASMLDGDQELARLRMSRHLQTITDLSS